ncbi:cleavage polyadenylation factor subunit [Starmerella bacillaris]|uniref:Cleavage polyadenylation factor subunit n=1 Tax=Starmerella bacillaris TaxID=1247836 RepID=A0AAV5RH51_STABA|nr:cleavage polyadenylation factor subunit [Starmerella bacillaris]
MSSTVYYRFKSCKDLKRVNFDGTSISVFELKRGILLCEKLDQTADSFNLSLFNPDTGGVYDDDSETIPRSSSVLASRTPVTRLGAHYTAARYVTGSMTVNARNASRRENFSGENANAASADDEVAEFYPSTGSKNTGSESDMMSAMFAAQGAQWDQTQQEMASKTPIYYQKQKPNEVDKTVPAGYICNRCGQKGHWITQCPSLYDPSWETKKVRRTTGIPKAMLRTVEKPSDEDDGRTYMMNADGEYVVALADERSWEDFQMRQLQQQRKTNREIPDNLKDPLTNDLFKSPVKMPCCGTTYSEQAIENNLIQNDFQCPNCGKQDVYIDQLEENVEIADKVEDFLELEKEAANENGSLDGDKSDRDASMHDSDSDDYDPERRGSVGSVGSDKSLEPRDLNQRDSNGYNSTNDGKPDQPVPIMPMIMPMMMPYMLNPFLSMPLPQVERKRKAYEDSDDLAQYDGPVMGRIR